MPGRPARYWLCVIAGVSLLAGGPAWLPAVEAGVVVGPDCVLPPGIERGEVLLGELGCVSCHAAPESVRTRLASPPGPVLGRNGLKITPQFLRAYLESPAHAKPGTTMPDTLAGLSERKRADAVESLVHFLVSIAPADTSTNNSGDSAKVVQGRELFHKVGCVACHAPETPKGDTDAEGLRQLQAESVPLANLAMKFTVSELSRFLLDPVQFHPAGRMPSLNLTSREANLLAVYLVRAQSPATASGGETATLPGLAYQYFEIGRIQSADDLDARKPVDEGFVNRVELSPPHRAEHFGFRFQGLFRAEKEGEYFFFVNSDDGAKLYIDGKLVVDNDGVHGATEVPGRIKLETGDHGFALLYFNNAGGAELSVAWQRPGGNRDRLPPRVLFHNEQQMTPLGAENFTVNPAKAARGQELFASLGCAACHEAGLPVRSAPAMPLPKLNPSKGCLADRPTKKSARYELSADDRKALRETLSKKEIFTQPREPKQEVDYALARFNCLACHARKGIGGPSAARSPYFTSLGEVDLGDEGRLPPHLDTAGSKLRPEWLREVLANKATARPYMATRMPQFGTNNVAQLATQLVQADEPSPTAPPVHRDDAKWGRKLVGTGGMSCISCHTFAGHKSLGVPAMDLALMTTRLQPDWFARYLLNPGALRPGTRMPPFWPEGKSARPEILGGDTARQISAIWAFLTDPKDVGLPDGLVQGKIELVADKEAVMYRNFIKGSPRSIGVGYPEKANLNWDANDARLVSIWQGAFIDAGRHREGRGEGFANALGYNVQQFPAGVPLALLSSADQPWPNLAGKAAGIRMKGYVLDAVRRPTFRYEFAGVQVEDFFAAKGAELDASFIRTLSFKGTKPAGNLWYRAWAGVSVEAQADRVYLLDGKIKMKVTSIPPSPLGGERAGVRGKGRNVARESGGGDSAKPPLTLSLSPPRGEGTPASDHAESSRPLPRAPLIRQSESKTELLLPVDLTGGEARIVQEIVW